MTTAPDRALVRDLFDRDDYVTANPLIDTRAFLVRRLLGDLDGCSILDVGCGDGSLSLQFLPAARQITLVDLSQPMLERARRRASPRDERRVAYVNADVLDFEPMQHYDVVLGVGLLAHTGDLRTVVDKLACAVAPGGRCILEVSDASRAVTKALRSYGRVRDAIRRSRRYALAEMTSDEVIDAAADNGLRLLVRQNYSFELPGARLLSVQRRRSLEEAVLRHPRLAAYGIDTMLLFGKDGDERRPG